ncbi:unnamed protein product, partial [Polarella glacialis]
MEAESLLRLGQYRDAFEAFGSLAVFSAESAEASERLVAPFRLRHDALLVDRLVRLGRLEVGVGRSAASSLRQVLSSLLGQCEELVWWAKAGGLDAATAGHLASGFYDRLPSLCPYPGERLQEWDERDPLSCGEHWEKSQTAFLSSGLIVVDDFFTEAALSELWNFACEAPCFRSLRPGYLGAFPADGCVHPMLRCCARALERRLPKVLHGRPLARWWLFKYTSCGSHGVGLHADDAAVNVNVWLTPDAARRAGGGLEVFRRAPPSGACANEFNRVLGSPGADLAARNFLSALGGVDHIPYKQNRACIFVSDRFHASERFDFADADETPRVNLTLLFGDRAD